MLRDPYDVNVAFDDVMGRDHGDLVGSAARILDRVRRHSLRTPMSVDVLGYDATPWSFRVLGCAVGDDPQPSGFPLFDSLHKRFSDSLPAPKAVRLDDEQSYADFREARRKPYIEKLDARLSALEHAFEEHIADGHGGKIDVVLGAVEEIKQGGQTINLPLQDCADGKIECWQDGPEILVTIRFLGPDGNLRMATSATQAEDAVENVVGHAVVCGEAPETMLAVVPPLARVVGAAELVTQLCSAADDLVDCCGGQPFVGSLTPMTDPEIAAAMALLQRCQQGDARACAEATALTQRNSKLIAEAKERLLRGQSEKARRSS